MRTDDQWFQPGDKVMRVAGDESVSHLKKKNTHKLVECTLTVSPPQCGVVHCVKDCWEGPVFNAVIFVGEDWYFQKGVRGGWPAAAFRKIEEIKLCVRAAEQLKRPVSEPETQEACS